MRNTNKVESRIRLQTTTDNETVNRTANNVGRRMLLKCFVYIMKRFLS